MVYKYKYTIQMYIYLLTYLLTYFTWICAKFAYKSWATLQRQIEWYR